MWAAEGDILRKFHPSSGRVAAPKLERRSTSLLRIIEKEEKEDSWFEVRCAEQLTVKKKRKNIEKQEEKVVSAASTPEPEPVSESKIELAVEQIKQNVQQQKRKNDAARLASQRAFTVELLKLVGQSMLGVANASTDVKCLDKACVFEGANMPGISVPNYLRRLVRYLEAWKPSTGIEGEISIGIRCVVLAIIYLDHLCEKNPNLKITVFNMHRLLLTAFLVSVKFTEDTPFPNSFWARVGGVPLTDLNTMESKFLLMVNFDLHVCSEQFDSILQCFSKYIL